MEKTMGTGLVSVILPIYNVQAYLDRCMESVVNQTYKNIEIIMVDDGSTDNSPKMCEEWAKRDERIKVIHKKNAGLGMARNTGLDNASGDYVIFVDSDDYIALDTVEKTMKSAKKYNSDIVIYGVASVSGDGSKVRIEVPESNRDSFEGEEVLDLVLPDLLATRRLGKTIKNLCASVCFCMFSMDLINKLGWRFASEREIISEDTYALLSLYADVRKVSLVKEPFYYYCENVASLTHVYRSDRFEKNNTFYDKCYSLALEKGYDQKIIEKLSYPYFSNVLGSLELIAVSNLTWLEKYKAVKNIVHNSKLQEVIKNIDLSIEKKSRRIIIFCIRHRLSLVVMLLSCAKQLSKQA